MKILKWSWNDVNDGSDSLGMYMKVFISRYSEGRFLSCLMAVGSTGVILKFACKCFVDDAISSLFKVGVGGTSDSAGGAFVMMT